MKKRNWGAFLPRFREEANSTSGLLGLGSASAGVLVAFSIAPVVGAILTTGSVAMTVAYCAWKAVPRPLWAPAEKLNQTFFDLDELESCEIRLVRVGFVGTTRAGKTTLLDHLMDRKPQDSIVRTERPSVTISALNGQPLKYYACIDAAGQVYSQQFDVIETADILYLFFDNLEDDHGTTVSQKRLDEHSKLLVQVLHRMDEKNRYPKRMILVLNKRDLWQNRADGAKLEQWFSDKVSEVKSMLRTRDVEVDHIYHSNMKIEDRTRFVNQLRSFL